MLGIRGRPLTRPSGFPLAPKQGRLAAMPHPRPDMRPAWRAAVPAYRKIRATGALDHPAHLAAKAAVLELLPTLRDTEDSQEAVKAVAYATSFHSEWFWSCLSAP